MDRLLFLSTIFCTFIPLTTIFALTPYISRKGTCFGVLLMEDAQRSQKIKKIKRGYTISVSITGILFATVPALFLAYNILVAALVCYCAACLVLYLASNSAVRNLVMTENWENFQKEINMHYIPSSSSKGVISVWWYAFYLPITILIWAVTYGSGVKYCYILPCAQIAVTVVMIFVHYTIKHSGQFASKKNVEKSMEENQKFRRNWSLFSFYVGLATLLMLGVLQLGLLEIIKNDIIITTAPFAVTIAVTAAAIIIAIRNNKRQ